jgi:preprotein translocase subunit YajC
LLLKKPGALLRAFIGKISHDAMQNVILLALATPVVAQETPAPGGGGSAISYLFPVLMLAGLWFLFIAPQRKKQKEHEKLIKAIGTGDEILTAGGIFGVVTNVKDDRLVVRIGDGVKVEIGRAFVQSVVKKSSSD